MRSLSAICVALMFASAASYSGLDELRQRAAEGDGDALYHLARLYDTGYDSIPVDTAMSTSLYIRAAEAGNVEAQNYLGYRLYRGEGTARDPEQALQWLETAAMAGSAKAASNLGFLLLEGDNVVHDPENAAFWLGRAAEQGVASAQSMLGDLYQLGIGVGADPHRADSLYCRAFEQGLPDAGVKLYELRSPRYATLCADSLTAEGLYFYTRRLPAIGVSLFEIGMEKGSAHAAALLGDAYTRAQGTGYDHQKALDLYAAAAADGYAPAMFIISELLEIFPDALDSLGDETERKWSGLPRDAGYWLRRAREAGVADASEANRRLLSDN